jgi:hypothetical protein
MLYVLCVLLLMMHELPLQALDLFLLPYEFQFQLFSLLLTVSKLQLQHLD